MSTTAIIAIGTSLYAVASEVIGANEKWKSNTVIQAVMAGLGVVFGRGRG